MAVKYSIEETLGLKEQYIPSYDVVAEQVALTFQFDVLDKIAESQLAQKDIAAKMGVVPSTLSALLKRGANLTIRSMARVAHALGYAISAPRLVPLIENYSFQRESPLCASCMYSSPQKKNWIKAKNDYSNADTAMYTSNHHCASKKNQPIEAMNRESKKSDCKPPTLRMAA